MQRIAPYAPVVLRIGIALVYIWFGVSQLTDPTAWTAYVPDFATSITSLSALALVHMNGIFEVIAGAALLLGIFTRVAALLLALHMLDIVFML